MPAYLSDLFGTRFVSAIHARERRALRRGELRYLGATMSAKKSKKSTTSKKKKSATTSAPFPFLGQGDAEYFEWFEMWVWFKEPIPKAKQKAIVKDAPKLCALDAQWPSPELLWPSTGDQWIQRHLVEEYGSKAAKKKVAAFWKRLEEDESLSHWDGDDDEMIAMGDETKKFNADIEAWLLRLHAKHPILFVARGEDGEAGGTKLGAWHKKSVDAFVKDVLPILVKLPKPKEDDLRRAAIGTALAYVDPKLIPAKFQKLDD